MRHEIYAGGQLVSFTEDGEEAPRRLIPKSVVQERVNDVGKLEGAFAALQADALAYCRWFAPDWPNVYADDEGLLAMLDGIGCTEEEIAAITAPA